MLMARGVEAGRSRDGRRGWEWRCGVAREVQKVTELLKIKMYRRNP